jgi:Protein of unknown function (DUF2786)
MAVETQNYIDKINKLLALAERAGTEEEAQLAYAKAQDLMTRWAIDEAMLRRTDPSKSNDEIIRDDMKLKRSGLFKSMVQLIVACAEPNDVKVLVRNPTQWKDLAGVVLIGYSSDIAKVQMLFASLWIQCGTERNRAIKNLPSYYSKVEVAKFRRSFAVGYAWRIGDRLMEARKTTVEETDIGQPGTALMLRDRSAEVQDFFDGVPKGKAQRDRSKYDFGGVSQGGQAANRADIGQPKVGGNRRAIGR